MAEDDRAADPVAIRLEVAGAWCKSLRKVQASRRIETISIASCPGDPRAQGAVDVPQGCGGSGSVPTECHVQTGPKGFSPLQVLVRDNNVDQALRV
ncbi:hypothetical protein, partial [uncultured Methylobacterium sp.]|uniref:hypothetical protein n=1 Tax=uncultured Methylobacterium sp. TaxID=157278 RepID=UPI0035CBEC10